MYLQRKLLLIAVSIVSLAIDLYVVHFPPAIVIKFDSLTCTKWFLTNDWVLFLLGFAMSPRIPLQADEISFLRTKTQTWYNILN